uniref:Uncharacterized protein n=1 Tax=Utricularia reniformis TaxID=192314 RepID=A0A1Y0AYV0_9LAMI|nr:hypothetical protein AEK19_MT0959 [Utricularia reniformis]ART30335.1 hypothetical protein AEK19_MT0959 [Utricularia reniformis]
MPSICLETNEDALSAPSSLLVFALEKCRTCLQTEALWFCPVSLLLMVPVPPFHRKFSPSERSLLAQSVYIYSHAQPDQLAKGSGLNFLLHWLFLSRG